MIPQQHGQFFLTIVLEMFCGDIHIQVKAVLVNVGTWLMTFLRTAGRVHWLANLSPLGMILGPLEAILSSRRRRIRNAEEHGGIVRRVSIVLAQLIVT